MMHWMGVNHSSNIRLHVQPLQPTDIVFRLMLQ